MNRIQNFAAGCHDASVPRTLGPCSKPKRSIGPGVLGVLLVLSLFTTGCFRPSSGARALRDCVLEAAGEGWSANIEMGVGPLTFGLARAGSRFVELPEEAQIVLRSMRAVEVGVYQYYGVLRPKAGAELLPSVDKQMAERGWGRLVAVLDGHETVALYVPDALEPEDPLRLCVLVLTESEMVIVSARGNPEPLIQLALSKAREDRLAEVLALPSGPGRLPPAAWRP